MPTHTNPDTFPFNLKHIVKFKRELKRAGGFDELMLKKRAISLFNGNSYVLKHKDIEKYKSEFLIGAYATLRPMYDTEMPYIFWSALNEILERKQEEFNQNKI